MTALTKAYYKDTGRFHRSQIEKLFNILDLNQAARREFVHHLEALVDVEVKAVTAPDNTLEQI